MRSYSSRSGEKLPAEGRGNALAAALDGDPPGPGRRLADLLEIAGLVDPLAIDVDDDVAGAEAERGGGGVVRHVDDHHAGLGTLQLHLVGQRRRQIGNARAGEGRAAADVDLVAR